MSFIRGTKPNSHVDPTRSLPICRSIVHLLSRRDAQPCKLADHEYGGSNKGLMGPALASPGNFSIDLPFMASRSFRYPRKESPDSCRVIGKLRTEFPGKEFFFPRDDQPILNSKPDNCGENQPEAIRHYGKA